MSLNIYTSNFISCNNMTIFTFFYSYTISNDELLKQFMFVKNEHMYEKKIQQTSKKKKNLSVFDVK